MAIISLNAVVKYFGQRLVVDNFSLSVEKGERLVILGPSGCGKTTILRLLAGFIAPDSGEIIIDEKLVAAKGKIINEPEQRNLGMVFQDQALWPHLTVRGNLEFGLKAGGINKIERNDRVNQILQLVKMENYSAAKPSELSGGQQQRVALARALVLDPKVLLMDEPLSNLDFELNTQLRREILRLQESVGFTLVYVTHDREEAYEIATSVVVMKRGRIERIGSAKEIRALYDLSVAKC